MPARQFDSRFPTRDFPKCIAEGFQIEATDLRGTLKHQKLTVVLAPAPYPRHQGHMIRVVETRNPEWYRDFYVQYPNFRRDLSLIALERIEDGRDKFVERPWAYRTSPYRYDVYYRELIFTRLTEGYKEEGITIPPNEEICDYFGVKPKPRAKSERFKYI